ncbi:MAG: Ig-like domain-containing protein [Taibaiella sp.]|nr:Ig-like domain-containing protein [Taibaiella sp.]
MKEIHPAKYGRLISLVVLFLLCNPGTRLNGQVITTIAGTTIGYSGDGGPATLARMNSNWGIAINHTAGLIYVSDFNNCAVRRVSIATGIITTIAGTGTCGFSGDGGPGTLARLNGPTGVAVDNAGNVYISDIYNNRVRKVNTSGIISTYAGNGGPAGSGDGGPAALAGLGLANGICMDNADNLYIPDYVRETVRKVASGSTTISTIAGTPGISGFSGDGGPALGATMSLVNDVATDNSGNVYISDWSNRRIRKVNTSGTISTFCGIGVTGFAGDGGPATAATTNGTMGFDFDCEGNMIVCDVDNHRIRKINPSGTITTIAGTGTPGFAGDGGSPMAAQMNRPVGSVADAIGNIYVSDRNNNRIRHISLVKSVCVGSTVTFCDKTGTGTWSITPTSIATISSSGVVTGVAPGTATITLSIPSGYYVTAKVTVTPGTGSIGGSATLCVGGTTTLTHPTAGGTWTIAPTSIATISATGTVTGVATGTAVVSYTTSCGTDTYTVTVSATPGPIGGNGPICAGATLSLTNSATGGTWSIAPTTVATISPTGVVTAIANGTANVTYATPCGTVNAVVTVNSTPGVIAGNTPLCVGTTRSLTNSVGGGTWSISPITVATISSGGVVTGMATGTATVSYTSLCGTATAVVTVYPAPGPILGNTPICTGNSIPLGNATPGGTWSASPTSVATITSTGLLSGVGAGTANVVYTTACGTVSAIVTVNAPPSAIGGNMPMCAAGTMALTNTVAGGTWSCSPASVGSVSPSGLFTASGTGTATVTYTTPCGVATVVVTVGAFVVDVTGQHPICAGKSLTLTATPAGGTWQSSATSIATVTNTGVVLGLSAGSATITYNVGGCMTTVVVDVYPGIGKPATLATNPTCNEINGTITLTGLQAGETYTVRWQNPDNDSATVAADGSGDIVLSPLGPGLYQGISITNSYGCTSPGVGPLQLVNIAPPPPVIKHNDPCVGQTLNLEGFGTPSGGTYLWVMPDGPTSTMQNITRRDATIPMSGFYSLSYTVNGCTVTTTANISVSTPPSLINMTADQVIDWGKSVQLFVEGAFLYRWTPNDGSVDNPNINNPIVSPEATTRYYVYGSNEAGCVDTATVLITVRDNADEYIPTAFTPNGDGLNDIFRIRRLIGSQKLIEFGVYNRYGERVYHNEYSPDAGWDGTFNGQPCDMGTYFYQVIVGLRDGTERVYKGDVTLIR